MRLLLGRQGEPATDYIEVPIEERRVRLDSGREVHAQPMILRIIDHNQLHIHARDTWPQTERDSDRHTHELRRERQAGFAIRR